MKLRLSGGREKLLVSARLCLCFFLFSRKENDARLTEDGECEKEVLEHFGADFGAFRLGPGLDGLQVTLVHSHLHLFRHTVGTAAEKRQTEEQLEWFLKSIFCHYLKER